MYACARASGEPRVPILTVLVATAAAKTTIEAPRRGEGAARRGATGRALAEEAIERLRCCCCEVDEN